MMNIAVHYKEGTFSERWIKYLNSKKIPYKIVDCFDSDIIYQLKGVKVLLWHHIHADFKEKLVAENILFALEHAGLQVFPDFKTAWHYDDKVAQKYLLESIQAPLVPSYVFYNYQNAINWVSQTKFPIVFKLRGGAGARNVSLIKNRKEANKIIKRAFTSGIPKVDNWNYLKELKYKNLKGFSYSKELLRGLKRGLIRNKNHSLFQNDIGYVYFQKFIPNNEFDIRIIIVGNKAFGLKRMVRKNDFKASGSGKIDYDINSIDKRCITIAFEVNEKLQSQCIAYDFVYEEGNPLIVEISYGFSMRSYDNCPGYWDSELNFYQGEFNPQFWMIENLLQNTVIDG